MKSRTSEVPGALARQRSTNQPENRRSPATDSPSSPRSTALAAFGHFAIPALSRAVEPE